MFLVSLGGSSMRVGGPFYSPKVARSCWRPTRKAILAFCRVAHRTVTIDGPVPISFLSWHRRPLQIRRSWRTGQSGAPPDRSCSLSGARSPSKSGSANHWSNGRLGSPDTVRCTPDTVRCTPDSPVRQLSVASGHASPADRAADRWRSRPLSHRTVRCTTGQSGEL